MICGNGEQLCDLFVIIVLVLALFGLTIFIYHRYRISSAVQGKPVVVEVKQINVKNLVLYERFQQELEQSIQQSQLHSQQPQPNFAIEHINHSSFGRFSVEPEARSELPPNQPTPENKDQLSVIC